MATMNVPSFNSPKRKRATPGVASIPPTPPSSSPAPDMRLGSDVATVMLIPEDDGREGSPRTKVAYNFQGLHLEDGGEIGRFELDGPRSSTPGPIATSEIRDEDLEGEEEAVRKRVKVLKGHKENGKRKEIPETPSGKNDWKDNKFTIAFGAERFLDPIIAERAAGLVLSNEVDPVIFKGSSLTRVKESGLAKAYPSINRLADSKSRSMKKRAGTPPLSGSADMNEYGGEIRKAVHSDRAELTWHDYEITGHNPTDPDDDGEGINGIGFKPTPAEAYARAQKRRQQMAEYRNREAREARKMRSERRRGNELLKASREEQETSRRVRFLEVEVKSIASTS